MICSFCSLNFTDFNYFHCKEIIEILKNTEKDTKSVFGNYGSQRMKDWQEIVKLYEKDSIYLGEAAQMLVRNVNYEIPSIKKTMNKLEQQSEECLKKIQTISKTENVLLNEHAALCQQLGIKGDNLKEEFLEKLNDLPEIYNESIKHIKHLEEGVDYYNDFQQDSKYLPIIQHIINKGNTTVYEYINREAPLEIDEDAIKLNIASEVEPEENNEIDFGTSTETNTVDIDFEVSVEANNEIDYGTSSDSTTSAEIIDFGDCDLNTTLVEWETASPTKNDVNIHLEEYGIIVEGMGIDGGIAKGGEAYTILDSPLYRYKLLDELYELAAFLKFRVYELNELESSGNVMHSLIDNLSTHDIKSTTKMLENLDVVLDKMTSERIRHLFQLKHSPKYAAILANKLKQKLIAVDRINDSKKSLKIKSVEYLEQKIQMKPILDELILQTKTLSVHIKDEISKKYQNRVVNLMGGVNNL